MFSEKIDEIVWQRFSYFMRDERFSTLFSQTFFLIVESEITEELYFLNYKT